MKADPRTVDFLRHAARAFFASAWANAADEAGIPIRGEIMDQMPRTVDQAAYDAARTLRADLERANGATVAQLLERIKPSANGDREATMEFFGHYAAMQAMGHGVGLSDAFGDAGEAIRVPYVEFGSHSLGRDYF